MSNRRTFIKKASIIGLASQFGQSCQPLKHETDFTEGSNWDEVASQFFEHPDGTLNFNTGSAGMMPKSIYYDYLSNTKKLASFAPYEVKANHDKEIELAKSELANMIGASEEEVALVRNTTEGIGSVLNQYPFIAGDEVIIADTAYAYPDFILNRLVAKYGIKKVKIKLSSVLHSEQQILAKYKEAITSKTRLIITTHILHREGQVMPIKALCTLGSQHGIEVLVDAAHALGQISHKVDELGCDYYVTSLHKWMYAPLGSGLVFIKKEHISKIDTGFSYPQNLKTKIKKFDYTGTIAFQNAMTLPTVLDFNRKVGAQKKYDRLKYLAEYLRDGLSKIDSIIFYGDTTKTAGIVSFSSPNIKCKELIAGYRNKYNIHIKCTGYYKIGFMRATVNLHLLEKDLDKFILATKDLVQL